MIENQSALSGVALTNRTTPKILPQLVHNAKGASTAEGICLSDKGQAGINHLV